MIKMLKTSIGVLILSMSLAGCVDEVGDKYVSFAKCLNSKNVTMYGAYWCPHCQSQKALFGELGFANINYVECDSGGENAKPELCQKKGIKGFPTWEFSDNDFYAGELTLKQLSEKTKCPLPTETEAETIPPATSAK